MAKVVVIGGGWAGVGSAISAAKAGADVTLLERTDMLLGTGLVGGIMRNNGRFTATEEAIAMGATEIFDATDSNSRHTNIDFPGHKHASLYDVSIIEPVILETLEDAGVEVVLQDRFTDVEMDGKKIVSVKTANDNVYEADVFIDCTGTAGPQGNCMKYGNGCAMCALRCPSFGPRVSVGGKAGADEFFGKKSDGTLGSMSGSCKLFKESLSQEIQDELNETGVSVVAIPDELKDSDILATKACQQYAIQEFADNIILLDTGHAKLMTPFMNLEQLRMVPGFEKARYEDPYAGGHGNSMRYLAVSPRDNHLQVDGIENLFCAGEKSGLLVGHTEAIITGHVAGNNAVRTIAGKDLLTIPTSLAVGEAIDFVGKQMNDEEGLKLKYTFSGSVLLERLEEKNLYTTDMDTIKSRVEEAGMTNIFNEKIV